jgi:hypothetical protein
MKPSEKADEENSLDKGFCKTKDCCIRQSEKATFEIMMLASHGFH